MADQVNNPKHYTSHPSGVECIQVTEHMGFNLGNAMNTFGALTSSMTPSRTCRRRDGTLTGN